MVRRAVGYQDIVECIRIRLRVFVAEQAVPIGEEVDAYDASAMHYLAFCEGRAVGTARLVGMDASLGKIGRVAVVKEYRGIGVGSMLLAHLIRTDGSSHSTLMLDAQVDAIAFYERFGFRATGGVFLDAGILHRRMERPRGSDATGLMR